MNYQSQTLQVRREALAETRVDTSAVGAPKEGEIVVAVDKFALTANNITYAIVGERIGYWQFFPAADDWGVIPVWGFADVVESAHPDITVGERLYGYWPMGTHLTMQPVGVSARRLFDGSAHRRELPKTYNGYARVSHEEGYDSALDNARMLLFPLYATSYCLYDFLLANEWFGAEQVLVLSASSKTAIGLGYALADDDSGRHAVGVTSPGNVERVTALSLYDSVASYDDLAAIDADKPTVIIDMSGNGNILAELHGLLGENMRYTSNVGVTHYAHNRMAEGFIAERSKMFFAPGHMEMRAAEWGPGEFERRALAFWHNAATRSDSWLNYEHASGMAALTEHYRKQLGGDFDPHTGLIVNPTGD